MVGMQNALSTYDAWRATPTADPILKKELARLKNSVQIKKAFGERMTFGTAGMRGLMGAGTNKINIHTIGAAAQSYAQYLMKHVAKATTRGVVVAHDNRHNSSLFSLEVVRVLAFYKIKTYLFEKNELQPTPVLSYAVRRLKAAGGVMITASHNPKWYNGFKVYNALGGQLMPAETTKISKLMANTNFLKINHGEPNPFFINKNLLQAYCDDLLKLQLRPNDDKLLKVVYSPLNGTGAKLVPKLLQKMNISYRTVKHQMTPDPNFTHTKSPNPENPSAYNRAVRLARRTKADLALLTDPDADRVGVVYKHKQRYKYLTGNQAAALCLNYRLEQMHKQGKIPKNGYIVKSNVSSDLGSAVAKRFNIKVYETHVGFKNIADLIERKKNETFVFGYEESYGFLVDASIARDKDALQGVVAVTEAANYYKTQGSSLFYELAKLYQRHGFHYSLTQAKKNDPALTNRFLDYLTTTKRIGNLKVVKCEDYRNGLPGYAPSTLVKVYLEKSGWFAVRPSGTEPKVKYYYSTSSDKLRDVVLAQQEIQSVVNDQTMGDVVTNVRQKTLWKFALLTAVLIAILVVLLYTVYHTKSTNSALTIFRNVWKLMTSNKTRKVWLFLLFFTSGLIWLATSCFVKRCVSMLGQKITWRRALTSTIVAVPVSAVMPFASGGSLVSYWYLRQFGYHRKVLLTTFLMNALVYQVSLAARTIIFAPWGLILFHSTFLKMDPKTRYLVYFLIVAGFCFDVFATAMLVGITMYKRMQHAIINTSVLFLEWLPFTTVSNPLGIKARYEYECQALRTGMYHLWQHKFLMLELFGYEMVGAFYSGYLFAALAFPQLGNVYSGSYAQLYLRFLAGTNLIRSANNFVPVPGSSGVTEWMSKAIFLGIFKRNPTSSAQFTAVVRIWTYILPTLFSSLFLGWLYTNIRLQKKVETNIKYNKLLNKKAVVQRSRFKQFSLFVLLPITLLLVGALIYMVLTNG